MSLPASIRPLLRSVTTATRCVTSRKSTAQENAYYLCWTSTPARSYHAGWTLRPLVTGKPSRPAGRSLSAAYRKASSLFTAASARRRPEFKRGIWSASAVGRNPDPATAEVQTGETGHSQPDDHALQTGEREHSESDRSTLIRIVDFTAENLVQQEVRSSELETVLKNNVCEFKDMIWRLPPLWEALRRVLLQTCLDETGYKSRCCASRLGSACAIAGKLTFSSRCIYSKCSP